MTRPKSLGDAVAARYDEEPDRKQPNHAGAPDFLSEVRTLAEHCDKHPGFFDTLSLPKRGEVERYRAYSAKREGDNTNQDGDNA